MRWAVHIARVGLNRNTFTGFGNGTQMKEFVCKQI